MDRESQEFTPEFTVVSDLESGTVKPRTRKVTTWSQARRYINLFEGLVRRESTESILIGKKQRAALLGLIVGVAMVVFRFVIGRVGEDVDFLHLGLFSLVLGCVFYLVSVWVLEFKVQRYNYLMVLPFPAILVFVASLYLNQAFFEEFKRVYQVILYAGSAVGLVVISYILLMSANIFNVASFTRIPLLQVAQTVRYIFSILVVFLGVSLVYVTDWNPGISFLVIFLGVLLVALNNLWSFRMSRARLTWSSIGVAFIVSQAAFFLTFWPVPLAVIGLFAAVLFYFLVGMIMHILKNAVSRALIFEYILVLAVVLVLVVSSAEWGIGGRIWNW